MDAAIDLAALARLDEDLGNDPAVLAEIVDSFLTEVPRLLDELDRALAASDSVTVERVGHTLKSSAGLFGAMPLCALARELELVARKDAARAAALAPQLRPEFERVRTALRSLPAGAR